MLQNLANKPTHQKELYMNSLNFFLDENKDLMNKFLNELADVSDFTEALEVRLFVFVVISLKPSDGAIYCALQEGNRFEYLDQ